MFSSNEFISVQPCRLLISHYMPGERLTISVADANRGNSVIWALSDLSGAGALSVSSDLTGRSIVLASVAISSSAIICTAPDNAVSSEDKNLYVAPVIDLSLNLWALDVVKSIGLTFDSTRVQASRASIGFAIGSDLNNMTQLQRASVTTILWPTSQ